MNSFRKITVLTILYICFNLIILSGTFVQKNYNVNLKIGHTDIRTQRFKNLDLAIFEIFRTNLLRIPNLRSIEDEDYDVNVSINIKESNSIFITTIEIIHNNLKSTANLEKHSSLFYEIQSDLIEIVIQVLNLDITREQYISSVNVATKSLSALIHYGNALNMLKRGENLEVFFILSEGILADGSFAQLLTLYNNVFRKLERLYNESIRSSRLNRDNYLKLIDLYSIYGDSLKALEVIQEAKKIFGETREFLLKEGDLYFNAEAYGRAISIYENILRNDRDNKDVLYRLGQSYLNDRDHEKAISAFNQILSRYPSDILAMMSLAEVYQDKGDYSSALSKLRELLRLSGETNEIQHRIAYVYFLNKEYEKAIDVLKAIIARDQGNVASLKLLGDIYSHNGDYRNAVIYYQRVIGIDPESIQTYDKIAGVYQKTDDRRLYEIYLSLGKLHLSKGEYEKAKEYYSKIYEIDRNDPYFYFEMGNLHFILVDYEQAVGFYEKAESLGMNESLMFKNMTSIYIFQNRLKRAMNTALKYLEAEPDNAEALFTLGKIYHYQKDYEKALEIFESLKDKMHDNYEYFYLLSIISIEKGNFKQGIENLNRAFAISRDMKLEHPYPKTYASLVNFLNSIHTERADEYSLVIAMPESSLDWVLLDIKGKKYNKALLKEFLAEIISSRLRIKSNENTMEFIKSNNIDIYSQVFLTEESLNNLISRLKSDGIIYIGLNNQPQNMLESYDQGILPANFVFFRRGMDSPREDSVILYVPYQKSIILFYSFMVLAIALFTAGCAITVIKYKAFRNGYGALRIRIIFPANRRIPMNVTLYPTKRIATLEMGEVLFTRLVVGEYFALFRGILTRYDEIMDEEREIGHFRMKERVIISKNEISEIVLDFSKELYIEVYITFKNQYVDGAEVTIRELNITKFTNESGYVSFILPKMNFTFLVSYKEYHAEKKVKIEDDNATIFIEIDPFLYREGIEKKPVDKIEFEYLE